MPDKSQDPPAMAEESEKLSWFPPLRWWQGLAPLVQYSIFAIGGVLGLILLIFVIGFGIAIIGEPVPTAQRIGAIRDILLIIAVFLLVCIVIAATALVLQFARLADTLRGEIRPMLDNTREATETVRGTARFVSKNVTEPIISGAAVFAGVMVFLRELGGIRRAIRKRPARSEDQLDDEAE